MPRLPRASCRPCSWTAVTSIDGCSTGADDRIIASWPVHGEPGGSRRAIRAVAQTTSNAARANTASPPQSRIRSARRPEGALAASPTAMARSHSATGP
jgi:hypothetical protein